MNSLPAVRRILSLILSSLLLIPLSAHGQQTGLARPTIPRALTSPPHETVAILDLQAVGANTSQASTLTDLRRAGPLSLGKFTLNILDRMDLMTDATIRAKSARDEGSYFIPLDSGISPLAAQVAADQPAKSDLNPWVTHAQRAVTTPGTSARSAEEPKPSSKSHWWWWVLGGVVVLAAVVAANSSSKKSSSAPPSQPPPACTSDCNTIGFSW